MPQSLRFHFRALFGHDLSQSLMGILSLRTENGAIIDIKSKILLISWLRELRTYRWAGIVEVICWFFGPLVLVHQYACDLLRRWRWMVLLRFWFLLWLRWGGELSLLKLGMRRLLRLIESHFGNTPPLVEYLKHKCQFSLTDKHFNAFNRLQGLCGRALISIIKLRHIVCHFWNLFNCTQLLAILSRFWYQFRIWRIIWCGQETLQWSNLLAITFKLWSAKLFAPLQFLILSIKLINWWARSRRIW